MSDCFIFDFSPLHFLLFVFPTNSIQLSMDYWGMSLCFHHISELVLTLWVWAETTCLLLLSFILPRGLSQLNRLVPLCFICCRWKKKSRSTLKKEFINSSLFGKHNFKILFLHKNVLQQRKIMKFWGSTITQRNVFPMLYCSVCYTNQNKNIWSTTIIIIKDASFNIHFTHNEVKDFTKASERFCSRFCSVT